MKKQLLNYLITELLLFAVIVFGLINGTHAQTQSPPQIIITWRANNFYPSNYSGKPLPSTNTLITASAEVLSNSKLLDTSTANFIWYADNEIIGRGVGQKTATFKSGKGDGDNYFLRAVIEISGQKQENSTRIFISKPTVVIENPYVGGQRATELTFKAVPYFFNIGFVQDLSFSWTVDGVRAQGNDNQLLLKTANIPNKIESLMIKSSAKNQKNQLESGTGQIKFIVN